MEVLLFFLGIIFLLIVLSFFVTKDIKKDTLSLIEDILNNDVFHLQKYHIYGIGASILKV
jgi:hypothetical protein